MPSRELSVGQWQVRLELAGEMTVTWGQSSAAFTQTSPLQPPSHQSLATQNQYTSKAEVSTVLKTCSTSVPIIYLQGTRFTY